jgi:hypothetical protein
MRLAIKLAIIFYFFLMMMSDTIIGYRFSLGMFCGLLFVDMVVFPQIDWKRKQQKKGSS